MLKHISIDRSDSTWVVRAGGAVIGETENALLLTEGSYAPVIYIPREDVAMAFLEPSARRSSCPHKGEASYYSIITKSKTLKDAVWSYEDPLADVAAIKGHLAFYTSDDVALEEL